MSSVEDEWEYEYDQEATEVCSLGTDAVSFVVD
jgi:hypothetical protein